MSQMFTIVVSEDVVKRAKDIAERTHRPIEAVLSDWFAHSGDEPPVEMLSDEQILALADMQLEEAEQAQLSNLLALNRNDKITSDEKQRLDELLEIYQRGMVRKAQALQVAVERGLRSPLS